MDGTKLKLMIFQYELDPDGRMIHLYHSCLAYRFPSKFRMKTNGIQYLLYSLFNSLNSIYI